METSPEGLLGRQNQLSREFSSIPNHCEALPSHCRSRLVTVLSLILAFGFSAPGLQTFWCVHSKLLLITTSVIPWFYWAFF